LEWTIDESHGDQDSIRAKKIDKGTVVVLAIISCLLFYSKQLL